MFKCENMPVRYCVSKKETGGREKERERESERKKGREEEKRKMNKNISKFSHLNFYENFCMISPVLKISIFEKFKYFHNNKNIL